MLNECRGTLKRIDYLCFLIVSNENNDTVYDSLTKHESNSFVYAGFNFTLVIVVP